MDAHSLRVLEFPTVIELVARHATCELGRAALLEWRPLGALELVEERQHKVREATDALNEGHGVSASGVKDIRERLTAAQRGATWAAAEFVDLLTVLSTLRSTRKLLTGRAARAPRLAAQAEGLADLFAFERRLQKCIGADGEVLDTASDELQLLRARIRTLQGRIQNKLASYLRDPATLKLLQEPLITVRDDRYVLPVRIEHRSQFPGLVLDASSSGATVFMEPFAVVDMGNELRSTRLDERREIDAILRDLSAHAGTHAESLIASLDALAHLDAVFAAARYGFQIDGGLPQLNSRHYLRLVSARHPLLLNRGIENVVPIDIEVGGEFHTLVITGPNTGGKTVSLKTLGLLSILALCGLPIPASAGTTIPFLKDVFADIGDEQAIVQNLSTFSSHMTRIIRFLPHVGPETLVLMDELGTGTDPREGTVLATSILEYLHSRRCRTVVTTHYSELKSFAAGTTGASNAAVEFDEETLQPTYRVSIGLPGKSCALIIAERLGMDGSILQRAGELLGQTWYEVEQLVDDLEQRRTDSERAEAELQHRLAKARELQATFEARLQELENAEKARLEAAAHAAEKFVESARDELRQMLRDTRQKLGATMPKGDKSERARIEEQVEAASDTTRTHIEQVMDRIKALRDTTGAPTGPRVRTLQPGDRVRVPRLNTEGSVVGSPRGNHVQVLVRGVKMQLSTTELEYIGPALPQRSGQVTVQTPSRASMSQSLQLDLRGQRADDAVYEVGKFIDKAAQSRAPSVAIIHGKGQGILRKAIQDYLKSCPVVEAFRPGESFEGGWGVTVVQLK